MKTKMSRFKMIDRLDDAINRILVNPAALPDFVLKDYRTAINAMRRMRRNIIKYDEVRDE